MRIIRKPILAAALAVILAAQLTAGAAIADTAGSFPAKVTDISDRAYEPAVIKLLDGAKESIILSMYVINIRDKGPVRLLIQDLEEALSRGVSVEIYLNTRNGTGMPSSDVISGLLRPLTDKGAKLYKVTPDNLLHDKLIIVDSRYVVDGSANWSVSALKSNYESAVLIDSPELAKVKLLRLRQIRLESDKKDPATPPARPKGFEELPEGAIVSVPKVLLTDKRYFSSLLSRKADRTMNAYLLLLAESARRNEREFFVSLEDMAVSLGMDPKRTDTALRKQAIIELRALHHRHGLIDVNFNYAKDAWVELNELPGGTFNIKGDLFRTERLVSMGQPAKFAYLIDACLESEGVAISDLTVSDLCGRFGISESSLRIGLREIGKEARPAKP